MKEVRNKDGKLVCRVDADQKLVEIVRKGVLTTLRFARDGTVEVLHSGQLIYTTI